MIERLADIGYGMQYVPCGCRGGDPYGCIHGDYVRVRDSRVAWIIGWIFSRIATRKG